MDLSFPRFDREAELTQLPADLAVLMVGVAARQAASQTAHVQAILASPQPVALAFAPIEGSFNGAVAAALTRWKHP